MTQSEFSRRVKLDEISAVPRRHNIVADETERGRLAERFALAGLNSLEADIDLSREAAGVRARGRVRGAAVQECVVSGQPVPAQVDEAVDILFTSQQQDAADEEIELGEDDCDILPLDGDAVDLGELAAETLSLGLNPYPRLTDDQLAEYRKLLMSEEEAAAAEKSEKAAGKPFAALKRK